MPIRQYMRTLLGALITIAVSFGFAPFAVAQTTSNIEISKNWLRETPPSAMTGGGFMLVTNKGTEDDRLIAVKFDGAKRSEIHTMKMNNGVMEMRPLENGIVISAGESAILEPGANHLMLMGLNAPLAKGESHSIILIFERAGEISVEFPVLPFPEGKKLMKSED